MDVNTNTPVTLVDSEQNSHNREITAGRKRHQIPPGYSGKAPHPVQELTGMTNPMEALDSNPAHKHTAELTVLQNPSAKPPENNHQYIPAANARNFYAVVN